MKPPASLDQLLGLQPDPLDKIISSKDDFVRVRGAALELPSAREIIHKLRASDVNVLITGQSGTGKELVAQAIHGILNDKPFVAVNAAGIPESLLEAEFFGSQKGAYTSSNKDREGFFEQANGGTLFLDEIGELPLTMQAKLLRVIQEKRVRRIGDNKDREVDFRLLSATNRINLSAATDFRQDLFYRIATVTVETKPLDERPLADITAIARSIASQYGKRDLITEELIAKLIARNKPWPGNVRQLENVVKEWIVLFG